MSTTARSLAVPRRCGLRGGQFHSPNPLLVPRMTLEDGRQAWRCGTCVANATVYQRLVEQWGETLPWPSPVSSGSASGSWSTAALGAWGVNVRLRSRFLALRVQPERNSCAFG